MYDTDGRKWAARSGFVVDYLSLWLYSGVEKYKAFEISLMGAQIAQQAKPDVPFVDVANKYLSLITQPLTDYTSIVAALKSVRFDVFYRTPDILNQPYAEKEQEETPKEVVAAIQLMLHRSGIFFDMLKKQ